jgi:hypothetical protein
LSSPGPDTTTRRLTTAAAAVGADKPQLAYTLASSDLSDSEIHAVGGFTSALHLSVASRLAANSGARTNFTADEKNQLAGIGEPVADDEDKPDSRSWLEKAGDWLAGAVSNTGNALLHNPVSDKIFEGLDFLGNVAHLPFRLLSSGLDTGNDAEVDREMKALGYDPNSTASYLSFVFGHGESLYHDLSKVRDTYGDDDVDLAVQIQADPEQFQADLEKMDPAKAAELQQRIQSADFVNVLDAVNRKHISPGRDLARLLLPEGDSKNSGLFTEDGAAFTALSGALDGAFDWFTDPTLILGKGARVARAMDAVTGATTASRFLPSTWAARGIDALRGGKQRAGLARGEDSLVDQAGVEALLRTDEHGNAVTAVGKGWQSFLRDNAEWRDALAKGDASRAAGLWEGAQSKYGNMMSLWDEVTGHRVIPDDATASGFRIDRLTESALQTDGTPIESLEDLAQHLTSTNGLLRINSGWAARKAIVMPGRLALGAELKAGRVAKKTEKWIDYRKAADFVPNDAEAEVLAKYGDTETVRAGLAQHRLVNQSAILHPIRAGRAKAERVYRRLTTQIPSVQAIDLGHTSSPKIVEQIARTYLNRGDAARLASAYQAGDLATRRAIVRGTLSQAFHASGLSRSEAGQAFMDRYLRDLDEIGNQKYGFGDTSKIETDRGTAEVAMYPDQISRTVVIPSFREMNYLATKFSVAGFSGRTGLAHVRAVAQGEGMDKLIGTIKTGWITSAAGGLRNAIDEIANFAAYGMLGDVAAARVAYTKATEGLRAQKREAAQKRLDLIATLGRKEADDRISRQLGERTKSYENAQVDYERALAKPDVHSVEDAAAELAAAKREFEQAQRLSVAISHRLPYAFRVVGDTVNDKLIGVVLGKVMSVLGKDVSLDGNLVKYASELTDPELSRIARDGLYQSHHADTQLLDASHHTAMDYHRNGLMARSYAFRPNGWGEVEADGGAGLDAMANVLRLRFADSRSPAHAWVQAYAALTREGMAPAEALRAARDSLRNYLDGEEARHFVDQAEIFHWYKGAQIDDADEVTKALAKDEYADRASADLVKALAKRGGGEDINRALLDELAAGRVPDRSWLANNLPTAERPSHAIGQLWAPYNPAHAPGQFPRGYTQFMSRAYDKVVTDQINALSRNPLVAALYVRARENTEGYVKHLVNNGWDEGVAEDMAKRISLQQAESEAFKHIDNPYVSSQFSLLSRNYWAFVRAQEDWLKRWGRTIKDNPQLIRQAQLLIHGGEATGLLEADDQGQLHFVYPGSSLMMGVLNGFGAIMGQDNLAQIPVSGELSSQLTFLNPSLDNPVGFSGTPLISLPWKAIGHFLGPSNSLFTSSMDQVINGQLGAGRKWYEQLFPSTVNRIIGSVIDTGDNSRFGQSVMQTLAHMEAAGQLDAAKYQTPEGKAQLLHQLQVGTHNNLFLTTLLGFFAPAAPSYDTNVEATGGHQGNTPDWSAHLAGLGSLKDEARQVFSTLPYEEALAWWQAVHPGELVYAPSGVGARTTTGTDAASAPATIVAAKHIEDHYAFYQKYGGKGGPAAYLIPQGKAGTKNGEFSDVAYRAQLELGIRDYKDLSTYFDDLVLSRGMADYFAAKDEYDAQLAGSRSEAGKAAIDAQWAETKDRLKQANPLLAQKLASYAENNAAIQSTVASIARMAADDDPDTVKALGANRAGILAMLQAHDQYQLATGSLGNRRGRQANQARQAARTTYNATISQLAQAYPGLADMARGAFRLPS